MFHGGNAIKHWLKGIFASIFYYTGLVALCRKINNWRGRRLTIISLPRIVSVGKNKPQPRPSSYLLKNDFDTLLAYVRKNYTILSFDQAYTLLGKGQPLPENSLVLTFDGCYEETVLYAHPALSQWQIPATVFLTNDRRQLEKINWWEPIREMVAGGISFGLHAETPGLSFVPDKKSWMKENADLRALVGKRLAYKPKYFAYADARCDEDVKKMLKASGYVAALADTPGINDHNDVFELRKKVINSDGCAGLGGRFSEAVAACELSGVFDLLRRMKTTMIIEPIRRVIDIVGALVGIAITLPIAIVIALIIKLDSPGPVLFRQIRVGKNHRPFGFYKFRTMYADARTRFPELYTYKYTPGEIKELKFKIEDDPRVTRAGRWLRMSSLDEIPNFINVLLGNMRLVGPRPDIPEMVKYYAPEQRIKLNVKPGITGLAQVNGRGRLVFQETLHYDCEYVRNQSLWLDIVIILKTLKMVLLRDGAF